MIYLKSVKILIHNKSLTCILLY